MRKKLVISGCLIFVAMTAAVLWPTPGYDISKVHPKLRELSTPYQRVGTFYSKDGSIGITIIDRDGHKLDLGYPPHLTMAQSISVSILDRTMAALLRTIHAGC
jgi:hypothetical protein